MGLDEEEESKAQEPRISVSAEAVTKQTVGQVGTPCYMAPEQVEANNALIGTRTDVYGLGTILFEFFTAQPPVTGSSVGDGFSKIRAGNVCKAPRSTRTVPRAAEGHLLQGHGKRPEQSVPPCGRPCRGCAPMDRRRTGLGPSRSTRRSSLAL